MKHFEKQLPEKDFQVILKEAEKLMPPWEVVYRPDKMLAILLPVRNWRGVWAAEAQSPDSFLKLLPNNKTNNATNALFVFAFDLVIIKKEYWTVDVLERNAVPEGGFLPIKII